MIIRLFLIASAVVLSVATAHAATPSVEQCRARVTGDLSEQHDIFRSHVFGTEPQVSSSSSSSTSSSAPHVVRGGGAISEARTGILEQRGRLASELVGPLVDSYRVLRCRSYRVCAVLEASVRRGDQSDLSDITLAPLGCDTAKTIAEKPYPECYFAADGTTIEQTHADALALVSECNRLVETTLAAERTALKAAVAYHGGYVSALQFSGIVQNMVEHIRSNAFIPLRQMMAALGKLHQIPCFIGQCDVAQ